MCPRFSQAASWQEVRNLFNLGEADWRFGPRYNIRPTEEVPIIRRIETDGHARELAMAVWWLVPPWADTPNSKYPMFNARAESLLERKAYAEPARHKRCLIPMTGWFEFNPEGKVRQPYYFTLKSSALFAVAGLWQVSTRGPDPVVSCTLITVEGNPLIARHHPKNRMPALLPPEAWESWLDCGGVEAEMAIGRLGPWPEEDLAVHAVDRTELARKYGDSPACIAPWTPVPDRG